MKYFGVAGNPILHSQSPYLFQRFFQHASMDAGYTRIAADSAAEAVCLFKAFGFQGMNVTMPFKNDVVPCLDGLEEAVSRTGSANTVVRGADGLAGFNTDVSGVVDALERRGLGLAGKTCVVLGAGGAGAAAAFGLIGRGAGVTVVNRTRDRAERLAVRLGCRSAEIASLKELLRTADVFVSAVPSAQNIVEPDWLRRGLVVLDADYKDPGLSGMARSAGCRVVAGADWLFHQALRAFAVFADRTPPAGVDNPPALAAPDGRDKKINNISLIGFMGCGKSSVGRILADSLGRRFVDSDEEIEKDEGLTIDAIFKKKGEAYFRGREKALVNRLEESRNTVFSWGGGVVLDPENRNALREHSLVIFLFSTLESCLRRIAAKGRPLLAGPDMERKAGRLYEERKDAYFAPADLMVNAEKNVNDVAGKIHDEICQAFGN